MARFCRILRATVNALAVAFFALMVVGFSVGSYRWAFKVNRMKSQSINPVMYPSFTLINTSQYCCTREPYYNLWRTQDLRADAYTHDRFAGEFLRVPVMYVHGNGGSYFCARSMARFLYEANVRQRRLSLRRFDENVRRVVHQGISRNASLSLPAVGEAIPNWLIQSAEERVLLDHTPMLATEMFAVDYLEESYTQSAVLMIKEARFLNHSMHLLMDRFLATYRPVLEAPQVESLFVTASTDHGGATAFPASAVELEYMNSCCRNAAATQEPDICALAVAHMGRYSSTARLQREVRRVRERGMWVWSESLGGMLAIVAALMRPTLYAGIVFVGSPMRYQPLFFDAGSAWLYKVVSDATWRHYPQTVSLHAGQVNWERDILPHGPPLHLIANMMSLPSEEIAARLSGTTLLAINGGALDDVVPSITGFLRRSVPRPPDFYTAETLATLRKRDTAHGAFRRDISTEILRGVGMPMDHRGLVYGLQFMNHSADSLVLAALLPQALDLFAAEQFLPTTLQGRLFPSLVETLPAEKHEAQAREMMFARTLRLVDAPNATATDSQAGDSTTAGSQKILQKIMTEREALAEQLTEICVDNGDGPIRADQLPTAQEDAAYLFDQSATALHLLFGYTTFTPDEVFLPRLELYEDLARLKQVPSESAVSGGVHVRPATKLHLPFMRKDAKRTVYGRVLSTLISFQATRTPVAAGEKAPPALLYPRFCFYVEKTPEASRQPRQQEQQRSFLRYDCVDPATLQARTKARYLGPHYVGNEVAVDTHDGYAVATGIDSSTQETRIQVGIGKQTTAYPVVIAGSLRSMYITARGNSAVPADDPEDQSQYFFGPFTPGMTLFNYSWKAFSRVDSQHLNETYLFYVVGDDAGGRPSIRLNDLQEAAQDAAASLLSVRRWHWWVDQWPERWLAFFSSYTGIGKLGGAYVVVFFTLFILGGEADRWLVQNQALCPKPRWAVVRLASAIAAFSPVLTGVVLTVLAEFVFGTWSSFALQVCLDESPPPLLSNEEMTGRMKWAEKATLVLLYAMKPNYRDCSYNWIAYQTVPVWASFHEHIATIFIGYVFSAMLTMILLICSAGCYLVGSVVIFLLQARRLFRFPRATKTALLLLWVLPSVSWALAPNVPIPARYLAAVTQALLLTAVPRFSTAPGYRFPIYMFIVGLASFFPSHFDGAALVIRNTVMLRRTPEAVWDAERNSDITMYQALVWMVVQAGLGSIYITVYLVGLHEYQLKVTQAHKLKGEPAAGTRATRPDFGRYAYVLGDVGRTYPWVLRVTKVARTVIGFATLWVALIVLRRPLEGGVTLLGNMCLLMYIVSSLVLKW